ncbi:MAG: DUF4258 domain-containing protein [Elusimicrobia bacterium]|nr:DUF4258 domain-containing protein [Elusimicrobiota bacterium]
MIEQIQQKIIHSKYRITKHAQNRCDTREITLQEIKHVILTGEIIESYLHDKPYPTYLILGYVRYHRPLYVLCGLSEIVHIITVHWLDPEKWLDPKTRREKRP